MVFAPENQVRRPFMKLTITTGTEKDFFERGKEFARKLDKGEHVEAENIISFDDPQELLELVTMARINLFKTVKKEPGCSAKIARRLHRDRSAVKRDVDRLAEAGPVFVEERVFRGHRG
jgi:predicted transcriptional regulator